VFKQTWNRSRRQDRDARLGHLRWWRKKCAPVCGHSFERLHFEFFDGRYGVLAGAAVVVVRQRQMSEFMGEVETPEPA
jgi:hypothetical protein